MNRGSIALRLRKGNQLRHRMRTEFRHHGIEPSGVEWLTLRETDSLVHRWAGDLGAERNGNFAIVAPDSGVLRGKVSSTIPVRELVKDESPVVVFFQEYAALGLARCSRRLLVEHIVALAEVDGNGFVAISGEMTGVLIADMETDGSKAAVTFEAWGDFVT